MKALFSATLSFFRRHRWARIALAAAALLLALVLALKPHGTKTFLILGMDNYLSLDDDTGRSDVMMLVQIDFTRAQIDTVTFARDMLIPDANGRTKKINAIVRQSDENALVLMYRMARDGENI